MFMFVTLEGVMPVCITNNNELMFCLLSLLVFFP